MTQDVPKPLPQSDIKLNASSRHASKAKQREDETWQFGWWDYVPLAEGKRPPVQWTSSSIILTAHATEPRVVCCHFPSSKQFTLPLPHPLLTRPQKYDPPNVIAAPSSDNWIFAHFRSDTADSVGCLWKRGPQVDLWVVKEWWTFARGSGIVQVRWLNPDRDWVLSESGSPVRLPHAGPILPLVSPILIAVTENHLCNVYYLHPQAESVRALSASLFRPSRSRDGEPRPAGEPVDGPRGFGRCTHATIGFGYDDASIIVATHASFVPAPTSDLFATAPADLTVSLAIPSPASEPSVFSEWELWREENTIEICEVKLFMDGLILALSTIPQAPIRSYPPSRCPLVDMIFVPTFSSGHGGNVPSTPTPKHRLVTPTSSPALAHVQSPRSPGKPPQRVALKGIAPKTSSEKLKSRQRGMLVLLCTSLDFGSYVQPPKSEIAQFFVVHDSSLAGQSVLHKRGPVKKIPSGVVANLTPCQPTSIAQHVGVLVGVVHPSGPILTKRGSKHMSVGKFYMLRFPDLQQDDHWEASNIVCPVGESPPFNLAISPNRALIASTCRTSTLKANTMIHPYPTRIFSHDTDSAQVSLRQWWSTTLVTALKKRAMPNDIVHILSISQQHIDVIANAMHEVEDDRKSLSDLIGIAMDIYKLKHDAAKLDSEKDDLYARYRVGHEICSLVACDTAWQDCTEDNGRYDLEVVWQLVGLSEWFMEVLKSLLKECVLSEEDADDGENSKQESAGMPQASAPRLNIEADNGDVFAKANGLDTTGTSCAMLHLLHPFALEQFHSVLKHVMGLRDFLEKLNPRTDNAQLARDMFVNAVDMSGVDLLALDKAFPYIKGEVKAEAENMSEQARRSLASLKPTPAFAPLQRRVIRAVIQAQAVQRTVLFIKPSDIVDGMLGLSLAQLTSNQDRDVVTKGFFPGVRPPATCLRCGGKSELGNVQSSGNSTRRWVLWKLSWTSHCVCGGPWAHRI